MIPIMQSRSIGISPMGTSSPGSSGLIRPPSPPSVPPPPVVPPSPGSLGLSGSPPKFPSTRLGRLVLPKMVPGEAAVAP